MYVWQRNASFAILHKVLNVFKIEKAQPFGARFL